jgi:hypothetical protein
MLPLLNQATLLPIIRQIYVRSNVAILWDVESCSMAEVYQYLREHTVFIFRILHFFFFLFAPIWELAPTLEHRADLSVSWTFTGGRTPWTGDQVVGRPLSKHRKTHTHIKQPCPEWDSNPRSRPPSERRQYMPQIARPPWPAGSSICLLISFVLDVMA